MSKPHGRCCLILMIDSNRPGAAPTAYRVRRLAVDDKSVKVAWRLFKKDGQSYMVHMTSLGFCCECRDFLHRRNPKDGCKHIRAMQSVGLLGPGFIAGGRYGEQTVGEKH